MTLGIRNASSSVLEQDSKQCAHRAALIDNRFWRRLPRLTLVAMDAGITCRPSVMSWKGSLEMYAEENGGALFRRDLALRHPRAPQAGSWPA